MKGCENMEMVSNAADLVKVALIVFNDPPNVTEKIVAASVIQYGFAVLG